MTMQRAIEARPVQEQGRGAGALAALIATSVLAVAAGLIASRGRAAVEADVLPGERDVAAQETPSDEATIAVPVEPVEAAEAAALVAAIAQRSRELPPLAARCTLSLGASGDSGRKARVSFVIEQRAGDDWSVRVDDPRGALDVARHAGRVSSHIPWAAGAFDAVASVIAGPLTIPEELLRVDHLVGIDRQRGLVQFGATSVTTGLERAFLVVDLETGMLRRVGALVRAGNRLLEVIQTVQEIEPLEPTLGGPTVATAATTTETVPVEPLALSPLVEEAR